MKCLEIDDKLDSDGELLMEISDSMDTVSFFIDKDDAKKIIEHIQKVFNLGE